MSFNEPQSSKPTAPSAWRNLYALLEEERVLTQNLVVGAGTIIAGLVGVAFQVLVTHSLKPTQYGDVFTVLTLITLIGLPAGAFTLLMARETSRDQARGEVDPSATLLQRGNRALLIAGLGIAVLLAGSSPLLARFLGVSPSLLIVASVGIPFALALPLLMGEFQGQQRFVTFSLLAISQATLRVVAAAAFGIVFGPLGIIAGISLGAAATYLIAYALLRHKMNLRVGRSWWRPAVAYLSVILPSTLSISVLLSADVLVVKHYFPAQAAGEYAAVAALGRAIFWGASGVAIVLFPKVIFRRTQGLSGFLLVNTSVALAALGGLLGLSLLALGSTELLTAFAGPAYARGASYLPLYGIGMTLLGGVAVMNAAHQSRGKATFLWVLIPLTLLEPALLVLYHNSLLEVVLVVDLSMALVLCGLSILYVRDERAQARVANASQAKAVTTLRATLGLSVGAGLPDQLGGAFGKRSLRILILNFRCPHNPRAGGAERLTHEVARRLVALGHSVEWFSASFPGAASQADIDGFQVVRAGNKWTVYWQAYRRYHKSPMDRFDLIIDEVNVIPFFAPLWSRLPIFMLIHQLGREIWWYEAAFPLSAVGFLVEPLYLRLYRNVHVLTVSSSTRNDLRRLGFKGTITVIPEGVETIASDVAGAKALEPSFLYVGRLVPSKRIEHMFMALARFRESNGSGSLWLVGTGSQGYKQSLVTLARRLDLEDHITFWGGINAVEKHRLMAAARALLMTSVREGWGLVVTEANACGTPAIVYDVPGLRDSVIHESTGLIVDPRPSSLADAMIRITRDLELYGRLVDGGRRWSQTMSFDETARAVGRALEDSFAV
jgi:glycosyltransferase involved in cell wall biosynthesis/O-antigen/teichoic acid export membrane protein